MNRGEIVISGAFPDCDEIYKQCLTDALVIFSKAIIREGYILTFGAHPTFQELFFETARKTNTHDAKNSLKMLGTAGENRLHRRPAGRPVQTAHGRLQGHRRL